MILFSPFEVLPNIVLNLEHIRQGLPSLTSYILENRTIALSREKPDILPMEENSPAAFACSLAAYHQKIPVAYIASYTGHCVFDHPSPENVNRRLTAVPAEMHFASTRPAKHCLMKEGIDEKKDRGDRRSFNRYTGTSLAMQGVYTRSVKTVDCHSSVIARKAGLLLSNANVRLKMMDLENPYGGDGQASERIVTAIKHRVKDSHRLLTQAEEFSPRTPLTDLPCRNL